MNQHHQARDKEIRQSEVLALDANVTGNINTAIGYKSDVSAAALHNTVSIGYDAEADASNQVRLGNSSITTFFCKGAYATISSANPNITVDANGQIMRSTATIPSGSGTTNQVAFWSSSGVLSGENDLYWDNTNNRLGIGIASPNQQLELTGAFQLPLTTSSTTGVIYKGGTRFMHDYDPPSNNGSNTFLGVDAGNFTMTGSMPADASYNTGVGKEALTAITSGFSNSAVGSYALRANTTGSFNTAVGAEALYTNSTGNGNTATGDDALYSNTTGGSNSGYGSYALRSNSTASENTAMGYNSLRLNTTAGRNTGLGNNALYTQSYSNGGTAWISYNVAVGYSAL